MCSRYRKLIQIAHILFFAFTAGCGGDSDNDDDTSTNLANSLVGVFEDSPVEGASYVTETLSGTTNANGEYEYIEGETVIFSIGALEFPPVIAMPIVTPVEMAAGSADPDTTATNIARLLQSLDADGNPDNGISIPGAAATSASAINFDVGAAAFESNGAVVNLLANSGSINTTLVSADAANLHLFRVIELADFQAEIVGRRLTFLGEGGLTKYIVLEADGDGTGTDETETQVTLLLEWEWLDGYFCRTISQGEGNAPIVDCQVVSLDSGVVTFGRQRGEGVTSSWEVGGVVESGG